MLMTDNSKAWAKYRKDLIIYNYEKHAFEAEEKGDINLAIDNFEKAARMGSTLAQSNLATILDDVLDPPRPLEAIYWYKRAVRAGDSSCAWNLAMHYKEKLSRRWYLHWIRVADKMGHPRARKELETGKWWNKRLKRKEKKI
jgi:TPR repeat protein